MSEKDLREFLSDLPRRQEIWVMIAELYHDPEWIRAAVRQCRESGYSWEELDHIARYEVAPTLWSSMEYYLGIGDEIVPMKWLTARIVKSVGRESHGIWVRLFGRRMMRPLEQRWREVERRFKAGDDGPNNGSDEPVEAP